MYAAIGEQLRTPTDFEEWVYAAQLLQARAVRIGLEWARANQPRCMGVLPWQLNDCWPALSWSLIDSGGRAKPSLTVARQAYAPRLAMIHLVGPDRRPVAYLANDTDEPWTTRLVARRMNAGGTELVRKERRVRIPARSASPCWDLDAALGRPGDPALEYVDLAGTPTSATFFVPDREFRFPSPTWELGARALGGAMVVEIRATSMIRDLALVGRGCEGEQEPPWRFGVMRPGQTARFRLERSDEVPSLAAIGRWVRCANQFGAAGVSPDGRNRP